jgi:uncharacterized protein (TIGR02569 family)
LAIFEVRLARRASPDWLYPEAVEVPRHVLDVFGASGPCQPLPGGQGTSVRIGDRVFKPADDPVEASWTADLFDRFSATNVQVPKPVRASSGDWVAEDWCAWQWVPGDHVEEQWPQKLAAFQAFHTAIKAEPKPDFIRAKTDPWSIADRMVWGEMPIECLPCTQVYVDRLLPRVSGNGEPAQLVHGDFAGNVLLAPGHLPWVIDFSPYWRPVDFALGVMVSDAITWEGADFSLVELSSVPIGALARGCLRRVLEHDLHFQMRDLATLGCLPYYEPLLDFMDW